MVFSITAAKTALKSVLLPYNFIVEGIPNVPSLNIQGAQIPGKSIDDIKLRVRGRDIHFSGNIARFENWTCKIFEDISYTARTMLELWTQVMADNSTGFGFAAPIIQKDLTLFVLAPGTENICASYKLMNCFPITLSAVELDYSMVDAPVSYNVTFATDFWVRTDISGFNDLDSLLTSVL